MATETEHRARLKTALDEAAQRQGIRLTQDARTFFVDRAIKHIYYRYLTEQNRDSEVAKAVRSAENLLRNLAPLVENRIVKSLDRSMVQNFARTSVNCIYPFCKPSP
jgi:hypothetical protein